MTRLTRLALLSALTFGALPAVAQHVGTADGDAGRVAVPGFPVDGVLGFAAGDLFGGTVAGAGDVNGDGYADLVVGAYSSDAGGLDAGRVYLYFGGPGADAMPDLTLTGAAAGDQFGGSATAAGDVNGDGYGDIVVGAFSNDAGGVNAGRAYVYFGGVAPNAVADVTLTGAAAGAFFGVSVAGAGDLNGDGYADLLVGASGALASRGQAFVYYGGVAPDATSDLTLTGAAPGDLFGGAVVGADDVNGDGYADFLIGASGNAANRGAAYVYYGGAAPNAVSDLTVTGEATGDRFGSSVAGVGDVNGDSYADLLVGAYSNDAGGADAGRAYVFYGGSAPDDVSDLTLTGAAAGDQFGSSVAAAGDVNGDSYGDAVVGARNNDAAGSNAGRAYVYFGGVAPDAVSDLAVTGAAVADNLGAAVAGAGDLDGDGLGDLAIGAPTRNTSNGVDTGTVYLLSNANAGAAVAEWRVLGAASDGLGGSVASAGDVNGDGYADVVVGARYNGVGGALAGQAYVYYGGAVADATPDLTFTGAAANDQFGTAVAGASDVNGDGYDDVVVGAPNSGGVGRAYVYYGGAVPNTGADLTLTGAAAGDLFGSSVASAGDINGDGYADLLVGAQSNDSGGSSAGQAYLYFGGQVPNATADLTFTGRASDDYLGVSVSAAGDVNGDGYGDIVVGALGNDLGGAGAGAAYVYFGGVTPDVTVDLTLTGATADNLGRSVGGAGDMNGDGYGDIVVSALYISLFPGSGHVNVYYGGPGADATPDLTLSSGAYDNFGFSVAVAGDVNGDGYADLLVGAESNASGGSSAGQAYVYFGGGDAVADLTMTGAQSSDFGSSVAGAGDVNGDGRADVLVGAPGEDTAGISAGAAYLYSATGPAAAPGLYRLADVPGDQGGAVDLRWTRSDMETQGAVTAYRVERSYPAGAAGYAWEPLATVAATGNTRYSLAAATYADQTAANAGTACFRVTADGAGGAHWRSLVRCGASIDNLAPDTPPALAVGASPQGHALVSVTTLLLPPADLAGYTVFRSTDAACNAADAPVATVPDDGGSTVAVEDATTPFGTDVYYCAASVDVHGNQSAVTAPVSANPTVLAAVRVVLEGAYRAGLPGGALMRADLEGALPLAQPYGVAPWSYAGTEAVPPTDADLNGRPDVLDQHAVVDWVLVCLRVSPTAVDVGCGVALLLADGTLLAPGGGAAAAAVRPAATGSYYVVVYHRNHLPAMSRFLVALDGATPAFAYDLAVSPAFVYGTNAVKALGGGVYALFGGNGDGNGTVLAPDRQAVWEPAVGQAGYLPGDYTLDGSVLADDRQGIWEPNVGAQSAVPGQSLVPDWPDASVLRAVRRPEGR